MVLTKQQSKDALGHVIAHVLGRTEKSAISKALSQNGINDIFSLLTLDKPVIEKLTYKSETGANQIKLKN